MLTLFTFATVSILTLSLVAKFELAFTRCRNSLETVGHLSVKAPWKTLMPEKYTYAIRIDQFRSNNIEKCSFFIIFECSHNAVIKTQVIVPFSNSIV